GGADAQHAEDDVRRRDLRPGGGADEVQRQQNRPYPHATASPAPAHVTSAPQFGCQASVNDLPTCVSALLSSQLPVRGAALSSADLPTSVRRPYTSGTTRGA